MRWRHINSSWSSWCIIERYADNHRTAFCDVFCCTQGRNFSSIILPQNLRILPTLLTLNVTQNTCSCNDQHSSVCKVIKLFYACVVDHSTVMVRGKAMNYLVVAIVKRLDEDSRRRPVESVYTHLSWDTQGPVTSWLELANSPMSASPPVTSYIPD